MPRLIDADALINEAGKLWSDMPDGEELSKELMKAINHAPTIGGWISVKDRLPEENTAVNIVWKNTEPVSYYEHIKGKPFEATGVYFRGKWYWWSSVVQDYLAEYGICEADEMDKAIVVTHWQSIPKPPEEDATSGNH